MANLQLSLACAMNGRTKAIHEGRVKADGIDLHLTPLHASELFWRQLHFEEFDISEMSMSSLIIATARGDTRWVGIPIFTSRNFFHTRIMVRADSGIEKPSDLKRKRVGIPEYQQTAALWTRAALQHVYDVHARDMRWWMERNEEMSHGGATGFTPPEDVEFHYIDRDSSMGEMLVKGELDAALGYLPGGNLVDRSSVDIASDRRFRRLFPDGRAEGQAYYEKTGFYPINHGFVVKREVYEQHPWVVLNIYNAFLKARDVWASEATETLEPFVATGSVQPPKQGGSQIFAYGVRSNQAILNAIPVFSHEQGLTPRVVGLDEVFAKQTLDL